MAGVWTRNYTNMLALLFAGPVGEYNSGTNTYSDTNLAIKNWAGQYIKPQNSAWLEAGASRQNNAPEIMAGMITRFNYIHYIGTSGGGMGIFCGSGAQTGDLYEAYTLDQPITSGLSLSTGEPPISVTYDSTNHKYTRTYSLGITNTSASNKTISEIALIAYTGPYTEGAVIYYDTFEPITLEQYESVVITISQSFPLINYQPYPSE